ncbi:hypothetical protein Tco_1555264 [Tanacetum coccineum]
MINLKIKAEEESNMASKLIKFIKSQIAEQVQRFQPCVSSSSLNSPPLEYPLGGYLFAFSAAEQCGNPGGYDLLSSFLLSQGFSKARWIPIVLRSRKGKDILLISQMDTPMVGKSKLDEDSQGFRQSAEYGTRKDSVIALKLLKMFDSHGLSSIQRRQYILESKVEDGVVRCILLVSTEYKLADIFTKALCRERFEFLIDKLGMRSFTPETLKELADILCLHASMLWSFVTKVCVIIISQMAVQHLEYLVRTFKDVMKTCTLILDNEICLSLDGVTEKRLEIRKSDGRLNPGKKQREPTFQVVLDALALTPCYFAFTIDRDLQRKNLKFMGRLDFSRILMTSPETGENHKLSRLSGFAIGATTPKKAVN